MKFAVLCCIALLLLGLTWFLRRRNMEMFLCILIAVYFEFFYLLPQIGGYKYLLLPILLILLLVEFLGGRLSIGRYGWWVIGFFVISLFGIVVAWFSGQSIMYGIKAAKFTPFIMVYFLLAGRQIDSEKFTNYFIVMALIISGLATITSLTHGSINFFPGVHQDVFAEQSGRLRINIGQFVISAATVVAFARFVQSSRPRFLMMTALLFAEVFFVQQTRGFIAAVILSIFAVYVLSHELTAMRISLYLMFSGFLLSWLLLHGIDINNVDMVKRTQIDLVKQGGSYGNSYQARLKAYDYYWKQIQKQPITGHGMLNFNWKGNTEKNMQLYHGVHLSDIGIMHFLVQAGLVAFIWLLYGLIKLWKDILFFRKHLIVACYVIVGTFTLPTLDMFLRSDSLFLFAVFLGLSSSMIMTARTVTMKTTEA